MKQLLLLCILLGLNFSAQAQCTACLIDNGCTANPLAPALCPDVLTDAVQGQAYEIDITFFIPQQFYNESAGVNVTLSQITITSVSGLPNGLSWTASEADNTYDITSDPATQRGCVKICGTPDAIGSYTIAVNVIATVTAPISTTSPQTFTLPLLVVPGGGGNSGFSFEPSSGCDSLNVDFQGLITSTTQPVSYLWDFGNGNTSSEQFPPTQTYALPDTYYVSLQTDLLNYVLESVSFNATGSNWCGDIEEPSIPFIGTCTGSPDIYFQYTVGSSSQQSATIDDNTSMSLSGLGYVINEPSFSLSFFGEDVISANDDLGSIVSQITNPGTYNFNTSQGYGSYTIGTQVGLSFTNIDTVFVFDSPQTPALSVNDTLVCDGDSVTITVDSASFYQWYAEGEPLFGSNSSSITTYVTGTFQVEVRNATGCAAFSNVVNIEVAEMPDVPTVFFNPITNEFFCNPSNGLSWIWLIDGVEMAGSTNLVSFLPTIIGNYSVIVENEFGCSAQSLPVFFTNVGLNEAADRLKFRVYPQPFKSGSLTIEGVEEPADVTISDASGRRVYETQINGNNAQYIQMPELNAGIYFVQIQTSEKAGSRMLSVIK